MSVEAGHPAFIPGSWDDLLNAWQAVDVQPGWRAEIIDREIILSPVPGNGHNFITSRVDRALGKVVPDDWEICPNLGLRIPRRTGLFIPDVVVVRTADVLDGPDSDLVPADLALLVVEITSKANANRDRTTKRWGYAHARVPIYLLIDRFDEDGPAVSVLTDPVDGNYREQLRVPFGMPVKVPEPFGFDLDTTRF